MVGTYVPGRDTVPRERVDIFCPASVFALALWGQMSIVSCTPSFLLEVSRARRRPPPAARPDEQVQQRRLHACRVLLFGLGGSWVSWGGAVAAVVPRSRTNVFLDHVYTTIHTSAVSNRYTFQCHVGTMVKSDVRLSVHTHTIFPCGRTRFIRAR